MDVTKIIIMLFTLACSNLFGQRGIYPKDTIYIKFENKTGDKNWHSKFSREYNNKPGIYFNIEDENGDMAFFFDKEVLSDTICSIDFKNYQFSDLKDIRQMEIDWIDRKFAGLKIKPYSGSSKNSIFETLVIERISAGKIVIYPVIWRNEGIVD